MMESEVTAKVGAKHAKLAGRTASRHGSEDGSVVLGGRRVAVRRPRARTAAGTEVTSESYGTFAADDLLGQVVMEHMLAGLATRRHRSANEPVGAAVEAVASAPSQSSVSRRFVAETTKALDVLMGRDLSELAVQRGVPSSGLHGATTRALSGASCAHATGAESSTQPPAPSGEAQHAIRFPTSPSLRAPSALRRRMDQPEQGPELTNSGSASELGLVVQRHAVHGEIGHMPPVEHEGYYRPPSSGQLPTLQ